MPLCTSRTVALGPRCVSYGGGGVRTWGRTVPERNSTRTPAKQPQPPQNKKHARNQGKQPDKSLTQAPLPITVMEHAPFWENATGDWEERCRPMAALDLRRRDLSLHL